MKICVLILLLTAAFAAHADVYRCTVEGKTVFADHPCRDQSKRVVVSPAVTHMVERRSPAPIPEPRGEPVSEDSQDNDHAERSMDCPTAREMRKAIKWGKVLLCMTMKQVTNAEPVHTSNHQVKSSVYNGAKFTQWYYPMHPEGWPTIVRFRHGKVSGWD